MNTDQLECAIKCDNEMRKKICGVFASNEISYIQLQPSTGFIANTDVKQLPGKHWVAFYYNENKVLEIFDSFGYTLSQLSVYFNELMSRYTFTSANKMQLQSEKTLVCGQYCLFYLMSRSRGISMEQIKDVFSDRYYLNDQFVYDFINERFNCCMTSVNVTLQSCICQKKIKIKIAMSNLSVCLPNF